MGGGCQIGIMGEEGEGERRGSKPKQCFMYVFAFTVEASLFILFEISNDITESMRFLGFSNGGHGLEKFKNTNLNS